VQQIEVALRKAKPGTSERYQKLARTHRQLATLAATLDAAAADAAFASPQNLAG
jgi:hypothetical protein